jgi:alpha-glucosidase
MDRALAAIRDAAGDAMLVGEVYAPTSELGPYLDHLDLAFSFEFLFAPRDAEALAGVIESAAALGVAWVLSNHDFPRLASRFGPDYARLTAVLLLSLPGAAFIYQGDEIGMTDGPGTRSPIDRLGRDGFRHPMQWDAEAGGGFTTGEPWLPLIDAGERNVAAQEGEGGSMLELYRELIALRPRLGAGIVDIRARDGVLSYRRGEHVVALNLGDEEAETAAGGELLLSTGSAHRGRLAPGEATIVRSTV